MTTPAPDRLQVLLDRACRGVATPTETEQLRARIAQTQQQLAEVLTLHEADRSNPLGPWCETCICSWPCPTARALQ